MRCNLVYFTLPPKKRNKKTPFFSYLFFVSASVVLKEDLLFLFIKLKDYHNETTPDFDFICNNNKRTWSVWNTSPHMSFKRGGCGNSQGFMGSYCDPYVCTRPSNTSMFCHGWVMNFRDIQFLNNIVFTNAVNV